MFRNFTKNKNKTVLKMDLEKIDNLLEEINDLSTQNKLLDEHIEEIQNKRDIFNRKFLILITTFFFYYRFYIMHIDPHGKILYSIIYTIINLLEDLQKKLLSGAITIP